MQSRDFTYVGTVCDVIAKALVQRTSSDSPVNLAFGVRTTVLELLESIERLAGVRVERVHTDTRRGDVKHSQADNELLRGPFAGITAAPLDSGLQSTIDLMRTTI